MPNWAPFALIITLLVSLGIALGVSEARKPPLMATSDTSLGSGVLTLGIALAVTAVALVLFKL